MGLWNSNEDVTFSDTAHKTVEADLRYNIGVEQPIHKKCAAVLLNAPKLCPANNFKSTIAGIKKKINDNQFVISRADKGNTVVILQNFSAVCKSEVLLPISSYS